MGGCQIVKRINLPDGGINIFISTLKRFRISKIHNDASAKHGLDNIDFDHYSKVRADNVRGKVQDHEIKDDNSVRELSDKFNSLT